MSRVPAAIAQPIPPPQDLVPPPETPLQQPEEPEVLPPPEELIPSLPPTPQTPEPIPGEVPATISVRRFEVVGNTVFSQQELDKVLAPFINRPLTFAELFQVRSAITQLYIDRGYVTSGALIPPQTLRNGVVQIQVVEGELEAINVTGTRRLRSNYVRSRIAIRTSKPLNQNRLLEALQLLQLDPLIENIAAELSAGSRPGTSVLEVRIREAKTFNPQIASDNGRSPSVGSFRRRGQINEANLFGFGDRLSLGYSNTDGSNTIDTSYSLPINPRNGTLSVDYGTTSSNIIEPDFFKQYDISASSRYYELTLRQPLGQTPNQEFAIGLTASRRESNIDSPFFSEREIPLSIFSPGADDKGITRISALRFFQEWTQQGRRSAIAARSQFSVGLDIFNSTINADAPDSSFLAWRGQAQWVRLLAPETLLLIRGDVQLADRTLVPLEQFGIGGQESIRGYRQDALLADNGVFASAEIRLPIYRSPQRRSIVQITPFVDVGSVWNSGSASVAESNTTNVNTLISVGLGLRWELRDRLTARIDWGIPLVDIAARGRTWQENGVYFSVIYNPF